ALPRDGALEQDRAGHRPAGGDRVLLAGRADHFHRDELACPLGVRLQLAGPGGRGAVPAPPLASSSTVSLVDMHPWVSSRSKVTLVASRSAWSRSAGPRPASGGRTHTRVTR